MAINLFKMVGSVEITDNASKVLNNISSAVEKSGDKVKSMSSKFADAGKEMGKVGSTMTKKLTVPIMALGGASFKMAADVQDSMGAVDKVFGNSSKEIHNWTKQLPSYYGVSKAQALEHASVMGSMLKNIGGQTEEVAATQTQALIELAGDLSAMYGGSVEESMSAVTSALAGNNQAMRKYGTAILDADVKQKAFELGVYSGTGAMSAQAKQAGTLAIIMDQTADAQGQAGREADQASGSLKAFTTMVKNLSVEIGEVLLPIVTPMVQKLSEWIQKFSGLDDGTKRIIVVVAGLVAAIGPALIIFGKFATAISAITGLFAAGTVGAGILSGAMAALGAVIAFITSPIGLVIAAVVAVIAIFTLLYKKSEVFRDFIHGMFQGIKNLFGLVVDGITAYINLLVKVWSTAFNVIFDVFSKVGNSIKGAATKIFNGVKDAIIGPIEAAKQIVSNIVDSIKGFFTNMKLSIPKIKLPTLPKPKITGSFSLTPPSVPKISWNAEGGIFDKATIFNTNKGLQGVGEAGAEAIMPLDKLKSWIMESIGNSNQGLELALAGASTQIASVIRSPEVKNTESINNNSYIFNINGDWTVDSDERQMEVLEALNKEIERNFRSRGRR